MYCMKILEPNLANIYLEAILTKLKKLLVCYLWKYVLAK